MTPEQIGAVLALAAARDRRTVGESDILAWGEDLQGVEFDEARRGISRHFRTMPDVYFTAGHLLGHVKAIRADERRHQRSSNLALPSRFETDTERDQRIKTGLARCRAVLAGRADPMDVPTQLLQLVTPRESTA